MTVINLKSNQKLLQISQMNRSIQLSRKLSQKISRYRIWTQTYILRTQRAINLWLKKNYQWSKEMIPKPKIWDQRVRISERLISLVIWFLFSEIITPHLNNSVQSLKTPSRLRISLLAMLLQWMKHNSLRNRAQIMPKRRTKMIPLLMMNRSKNSHHVLDY